MGNVNRNTIAQSLKYFELKKKNRVSGISRYHFIFGNKFCRVVTNQFWRVLAASVSNRYPNVWRNIGSLRSINFSSGNVSITHNRFEEDPQSKRH